MVGIEEKEVTIVKIGKEIMSIKIRYELIITTHPEGMEKEPTRIQGRIASLNKHDTHCHLLSSSQSFNLFRGSSGLDLKEVIRKEETNSSIASIIGTLDIELMNVTDYEGC